MVITRDVLLLPLSCGECEKERKGTRKLLPVTDGEVSPPFAAIIGLASSTWPVAEALQSSLPFGHLSPLAWTGDVLPAMADGGGAGSHRDARTGRPRVQQLRPTNKDASTAAAGSPASRPAGGAPAPTAPGASWEGSAAGGPRVVPRIVTGQGSGSTIIVNSCQRGNPLLKHIRNIGWEYGDIVPDYQVGAASCALFLSLRYHRLHPEYIHNRIQKLGNMFSLRILLVICDVDQHQSALKELTKVALVNNLTLMVAWT